MNPSGLRARAKVLAAIRTWFADQGFLEMPTPALVPSGGMEETLHPVVAEGGFLRTSPEFALKRVCAAGLPRVYEIGPCFRAREHGAWHGVEFTMLEWYRAGVGLERLMDDVTALVELAHHAVGRTAPTFARRTVADVFADVGLHLPTATADDLCAGETDWDTAFFHRWVSAIEPRFTGGLFVEDWPASQAALAQVRDDREWPVAQRFEAYVNGVELANAFLELTDPLEQRRRFDAANERRVRAGEAPNPIDASFIASVGRMPPTAGIALGVDRLVAIALGEEDIACVRV